jgi:hypothetical protein
MSAARLPPGAREPRGPVLVLRYSRDGAPVSVALPYGQVDPADLGELHTLSLTVD